jgi:two-component system heavy metal sensor histidine kinase CusS
MTHANKHSMTRRLVALFTLTTLIVVTLTGTALYHVLKDQLQRYQVHQVAGALRDRAYQIERADTLERWDRVDKKLTALAPPDDGMRFWVLCADPRFRYGADQAAVTGLQPLGERLQKVGIPGKAHPFQVLVQRIGANGVRPAVTLVVGIDTKPFMQAREVFLAALVALSLGAAIVVWLLGRWVTHIGLQPLQQLSDQAGALGVDTLDQRLAISPLPQELAGVTNAFNGALDRLQGAYTQLDAFNADVAHELRTPLANLIGSTQVALARQRSAPQLEEVLQSNLEELERLRSIVNDMLFLARAARGEAAAAPVDATLAHEVGKAVDFLEIVLDEAGKTVVLEGDLAARAPLDVSLFRRALVNLVHNAVLYSSAGAQLQVRIVRGAGCVRVEVVNPGATIDPVHLPRLFDRFYRGDQSRHSGDSHGHGLGLAIVKAIAQMHGGAVFAESQAGVTRIGFSVAAPAAR